MDPELESVCELVRECGLLMRGADTSELLVNAKTGHANFVTDYDKRIQEKLRIGLAKAIPGATFIGEEDASQEYSEKGKFFIVDPIDGTTNFIKGLNASCISVGFVVEGKAELGVVYNPYLDEMFTARRGCGAACNGKRIKVSSEPLENGIVIFGTSPYNEELSLSPWDYTAGALIVEEAGGVVTDINGNALSFSGKSSVMARNRIVYPTC